MRLNVTLFALVIFLTSLSGDDEKVAASFSFDSFVVEATPVLEGVSLSTDSTLLNTVGAEQITALGASDLAGALRRVPGVTVSRFNNVGAFGGGDGGAVFIRGHGSGRPGAEITTMVDGIQRFNGIWTHPLLDMVSVDIARRIEVYKSPQPVLFGNMAFGAVNIVPKETESEGRSTRIFGSGGKHETFTALAENGHSAGDVRSWFTLSHRQSGGHRDNADGEVNNLYAKIGYTIDRHWDASVLINHQTALAHDPRAIYAQQIPIVERYETSSTFLVGTVSHQHGSMSGFVKGYLENGETEWLQFDNAPPPPVGEAFTNVSGFKNYGIKAQELIETEDGPAITAGWDLQFYGGSIRDIYESSSAANDIQPERRLRNNAFYTSIAWELDYAGGALTPSAGVRYNFAKDFEDEFGTQAGVTYKRGDTMLYANFARAFNYAGLYAAIFSDRWSGFGVPPDSWRNLDAETLLHYEIGAARQISRRARVTVSFYYDDVQDALRIDSPPPPVTITNTGDYRVFGTELFAFITPVENLELFVGGVYQDPDPADVPNSPEWSFTFGAKWRFLENFILNVDTQYVDEQLTQGTRFASGTQHVDSYSVATARLAHTFTLRDRLEGEVFCAVENLTDSKYEHRPGYPMPGISPSAGFDIRF